MKTLFTIFIFFIGLFITTSCEDKSVDPTQKQLQEAAKALAQNAVNEIVSRDASAVGMSQTEIDEIFAWTKGRAIGAVPLASQRVFVSLNISENVTWTNDNIYQLDGRITVLNGATLTIEEGTRIEGNSSLKGQEAAVLMVAKGGKLVANGTAINPIIMTTTDDNGSLQSSDKGLWGGLVILGKAPVSAKVDNPQIDGVKVDDSNGQYGGSDPSDNSGSIRYLSIRFGGAMAEASISDASITEAGGLTLAGVGSETIIEYVEVFANKDDGIEILGGTVNVNYALIAQEGDDALDIDQSYAGTVTNFAIFVDDESDQVLEIEGRERDLDDTFTLSNGVAISTEGAPITCIFKYRAKGLVRNFNANGGRIKLAATFDVESLEQIEDAALNTINGDLYFEGVNAFFEVFTESFY